MRLSVDQTLHAITRTGDRTGQPSADDPAESGSFGRFLDGATRTGDPTGQPSADEPVESGSLGRILYKAIETSSRLNQPPADESAGSSGFGPVPPRTGAERPSGRQPHSGTAPANDTKRQAEPTADTTPSRTNWPDFTAALAPQAKEKDASPEPESDTRTTDKRKAQPDAPQPTQRQPIPDSGPWLIAPQRSNHDPASATADGTPFESDGAPAARPGMATAKDEGRLPAASPDATVSADDGKSPATPPPMKTGMDTGRATAASLAVTAAIDTGKPAITGPAVALQAIGATAPLMENRVAPDLRGAKGGFAKGEPAKAVPMPEKASTWRVEPLPGPAANGAVSPQASSPEPLSAPVAARSERAAQAPAAKPTAAPADMPAAPAPSVTVTGAQSFPAPATYPVAQTMTALASDIATDTGARQVLSASAGLTQSSPSVAVGSHMLKIELHPAELGMVTASLRLAGGQLSIELKPENQEAHRRLSSDTDTLVKSLQGLGFNVDKVTVLQPTVAANAAPRMDAPATANPGGRDSSSFQPGGSGANGGASGGQQSGRNSGNDGHQGRHGGAHPLERSGGGLFI